MIAPALCTLCPSSWPFVHPVTVSGGVWSATLEAACSIHSEVMSPGCLTLEIPKTPTIT